MAIVIRRRIAAFAALAALVSTASVRAHHSGFMYETTPLWIKGTVVRFERKNPHSVMTLEERTEPKQVRRFGVEGPAAFQLDQMGVRDEDVPGVGDVVEFCAFPYRSEADVAADPRLRPRFDP